MYIEITAGVEFLENGNAIVRQSRLLHQNAKSPSGRPAVNEQRHRSQCSTQVAVDALIQSCLECLLLHTKGPEASAPGIGQSRP